jgi:DNA-binding SARP family transcriptional activator
VPTERLVDLLWGEEAPKTATTSLQNAVSALRKLLGPERIETRPPGYVLRVDPETVDVQRFERLVTQCHKAPSAERAETLRVALALWRGPALAEFTLAEWAQPEIRRLEELRLRATEERIAAEVELGRAGEAVPVLETLIAEHPLRERVRELHMLALYRAGRQAEALQAYQDARETLVDQLGIEPGPALQELQRRILRQEAGLQQNGGAAAAGADVEGEIARALLAGRVVPVLGLAGSAALADQLATAFDYPQDRPLDLARVCQYVATMRGSGPLYDELHDRFEAAIEPGPLHRFLAALPPLLRERGAAHQLIVTTHYDLALERAFAEAGEELDVVAYVASGPFRGRFWHRPPDGPPRPVELPNEYADLSLERRTVLLKLRGAVDPHPEREWESFVVTEDDHIDYLGRSELAGAVPVTLAARLRRSHFLFLGYEMADWNLRLVLSRVWGDRAVAYGSWAIQPEPTPLELAFWRHHDVQVLDVEQDDLVRLLEGRLDAAAA